MTTTNPAPRYTVRGFMTPGDEAMEIERPALDRVPFVRIAAAREHVDYLRRTYPRLAGATIERARDRETVELTRF